MLMAAVELVNNDSYLGLVADRVEILDIGDGGCLERPFHQHPGVVRVDVTGVYAKASDL
jgi:hypothetical protein